MTEAGGGVIVALTFVAAIDDPARFRSSKVVVRISPDTQDKNYQSAETDVTDLAACRS